MKMGDSVMAESTKCCIFKYKLASSFAMVISGKNFMLCSDSNASVKTMYILFTKVINLKSLAVVFRPLSFSRTPKDS